MLSRPWKVLVLNNEFQGMVKQWQDLFYEERYSHTQMFNPEFDKVAEVRPVCSSLAVGGCSLSVCLFLSLSLPIRITLPLVLHSYYSLHQPGPTRVASVLAFPWLRRGN